MSDRTLWKTAVHRPMLQLAPGLWTVEATVEGGPPIGRTMTLLQLGSGELVAHSVVCADAATMAAIDALGAIAYILVPNGFHRLDAPRYKARYPRARVLAAPAAAARVAKVVEVDGDFHRLPADPTLRWEMLDGVPQEAVFIYRPQGAGHSLVFNDALFNLPASLPGVKGQVVRLLGSTGGPKVTPIARTFLVKDKAALASHLRRLSQLSPLDRAIPGHGEVIDRDVASVLRVVADGLHRSGPR